MHNYLRQNPLDHHHGQQQQHSMHEAHLRGLIAIAAYGDLQLEVQHPETPAGAADDQVRQSGLSLLPQPNISLLDTQSCTSVAAHARSQPWLKSR